jgi:ashwin
MKDGVLKLFLFSFTQKNIAVENEVRVNKDNLTDLYVQHAIPLPQRDLPKNRWGKMMEKKREHHEVKNDTKRYFFFVVDNLILCD